MWKIATTSMSVFRNLDCLSLVVCSHTTLLKLQTVLFLFFSKFCASKSGVRLIYGCGLHGRLRYIVVFGAIYSIQLVWYILKQLLFILVLVNSGRYLPPPRWIIYNYPPKGRWIVVDIYRDAFPISMYLLYFNFYFGTICFWTGTK